MASVHKTGAGTWEVRYREGKRNRSRTFKMKEEARNWQAIVERSEVAPLRAQDVPSLAEYATQWIAHRPDLAPSTQAQYRQWLSHHILPDLGHLPLTELTPPRLMNWQRERLADGAGPAVLGKAQTLLSQVLDQAVVEGYRDYNPLLSIKRPRYEKKESAWLTATQVEGIREWYLAHDDFGSATLVSVLAYIGIRPQDALALEWDDLDAELTVDKKNIGGEIRKGSKTGDRYKRRVYVPVQVRADLNGWRDRIPHATLIFPNRDNKPWTTSNFNNWRSRKQEKDGVPTPIKCFKLAAQESGLPATTKPYDLRHTAASLFADAGWNHLEIANQLGHSPEISMRVYQHLISRKPGGERRSIEDMIAEAREKTCSGFVRDFPKERELS